MTEEERDDPNLSMTILMMQEASTHLIWAYPLSKKGVEDEEWVSTRISADLESAGLQHCKIVFKSDQEPSVVEMQHDVMRKRTEQGLSTSLQNSPVGDSDNNGRVERAIRDLGGVARTMRSALEERLGQPIGLTHPLTPWLICQAANAFNRYQIRSNGKTAYKTAVVRDSMIPVCEFGEHVHFRPPKIATAAPVRS